MDSADGGPAGPFSLEELLFGPGFKPTSKITNTTERVSARAWDFPQVREGLRRIRQGRPVKADNLGLCPSCRVPVTAAFYEGVPVKVCQKCRGKLIHQAEMDRVLAREEIGFSPEILAQAEAFRTRYLTGAERPKRPDDKRAQALLCPSCGYGLKTRPYNYQYVIPVDKCLSCGEIWFEADEVEVLQALVEQAREGQLKTFSKA
jgi:Zn-finger nucleic acid-binding protein